MKRLLILCMFVMPLWATACDVSNTTADGYENISLEHGYQRWSQQQAGDTSSVFLDVRTLGEYQNGHVPHALHIPVQVLASRLNEVPKDKKIYVYCESGVRSTKASKILAKAGFTRIENMRASMRGWRNADYPIEK